MIRPLLTALLLLCASNVDAVWFDGAEWTISKRPPLVPVWRIVTVNEVFRMCGGHRYAACAIYDVPRGVCYVFAAQPEFETAEWLRWHELLHCAGWNHE